MSACRRELLTSELRGTDRIWAIAGHWRCKDAQRHDHDDAALKRFQIPRSVNIIRTLPLVAAIRILASLRAGQFKEKLFIMHLGPLIRDIPVSCITYFFP